MAFETVILTESQVSAGLRAAGVWPSTGPLSDISPAGEDDLTGSPFAALTDESREFLETLGAPARVIRATTVTRNVPGAGTTTFLARRDSGPYVAVARDEAGFAFAPLSTGAEAAVVVASHLGIAVEAPQGGAASIDAGGWSLLAALGDQPESSSVADLENVLAGEPGRVAKLFRTIGPVPLEFPDDPISAARGLAIAGVLTERSGSINLTKQGRGVVESLSAFAVGGSLTIDHLSVGRTRRVAMLSFIRSPERMFMGVWSARKSVISLALGEPGATDAIFAIRALIDAPSAL